MKKVLQAILQRLLGFERYLTFFSRFKIMTLRWDGQRKEGDFNFFLTLLKPESRVLDIGANIGIMTVLMAKRCKQGQVFAFEPVPENFDALDKVVASYRLQNVLLFPLALGAKVDTVSMTMPVLKGVRMQGLAHVQHQTIEGYEAPQIGYEVKQLPLDEVCELKGKKIDAIKIDVENYEQFVLEGAHKLLSTDRPIIYCELWDNENRQRCFEILGELKYKTRVLVNQQLEDYDPAIHSHHNFFFIPS